MEKREKTVAGRVIGIILDIILVLLVLYIAGTLYLRTSTGNAHASLLGFTTHVVNSDSMEPNIHVGDFLIVKRCNHYEVGDIITYIREDGLSITHRIIFIDIGGYQVKGDANYDPDPGLIQPEQIVGKVIFII